MDEQEKKRLSLHFAQDAKLFGEIVQELIALRLEIDELREPRRLLPPQKNLESEGI
jgi:hypothetical protein